MSETPTARELCRVGYEEEQNGKLAQLNKLVAGSILASRVEAVVALAEESRRKAVAGDGYGLLHAHEVLALLDGVKP